MSAERDLTPVVRVWLRTDEHESADRVLDAALDQIETTPQVRGSGPLGLELGARPAAVRLALAAAVLVAVVVGASLLSRMNVGDPPPTPAPAPAALRPAQAVMEPGTYVVDHTFPVNVTLTVPAGWQSYGASQYVTGIFQGDDYDIGVGFWIVDNLPVDGCRGELGEHDPPVGPSVGDLATALANQPGYLVQGPVDAVLGGHEGRYLELTGQGLPTGGCIQRRTWAVGGFPPVEVRVSGHEEVDRIWILDVDGTRVVVDAFWLPEVTAAQIAELEAIVQTIRLEPRASGD